MRTYGRSRRWVLAGRPPRGGSCRRSTPRSHHRWCAAGCASLRDHARVDPDGGTDSVHGVDRSRFFLTPRDGHCAPRVGGSVHRPDTGRRHWRTAPTVMPCSRYVVISISSPRPMAPSSSTPAISVMKRTQRVHWMQRVIVRLDQGAKVLFIDRALVFVIARAADAIRHRLILEVALAALIADRAVQWMVDQEEFHDAFARLLDQWRAGIDRGSA